jgi:hypothetical protein
VLHWKFEVHDEAVLSGVCMQESIESNRVFIDLGDLMGSVRSERLDYKR